MCYGIFGCDLFPIHSELRFIKDQYALIIFGDNGRRTIIEKVLGRVVVDTLGKVGDDKRA